MSNTSKHRAANYVMGLIGRETSKRSIEAITLSAKDEVTIRASLAYDTSSYLYNASISFLSGLHAASVSQFSWATTKLYYSAFYIARAALAADRFLVFHIKKPSGGGATQYSLRIGAGESPAQTDTANTHKYVLEAFAARCPAPFLKGTFIGSLPAIEWLAEQREESQYRAGKFSDPDDPGLYRFFDSDTLSRLLEQYAADKLHAYTVDREHAVIALPFRLLLWAYDKFGYAASPECLKADRVFLQRHCRVAARQVTIIHRLLST